MSKKTEKVIYIGLCCFSGCLLGFFANQLNTLLGIICFALGALLLTVSSIKICKL